MPNKWIEHVREFSKKHNISFGCALSHPDLKKEYVPVVKKSREETKQEKKLIIINQMSNNLINRIKSMTDDDKPIIRMKFNSYSKEIQDNIKGKYPKYYNKLFPKK